MAHHYENTTPVCFRASSKCYKVQLSIPPPLHALDIFQSRIQEFKSRKTCLFAAWNKKRAGSYTGHGAGSTVKLFTAPGPHPTSAVCSFSDWSFLTTWGGGGVEINSLFLPLFNKEPDYWCRLDTFEPTRGGDGIRIVPALAQKFSNLSPLLKDDHPLSACT